MAIDADLAILAGGFAAGIVNAIAGGGTLISFPTLLALGRDPLIANATNAVALGPGSLASAFSYRAHVRRGPALTRLVVPPLVGAAVGATLLLLTPSRTFGRIVPCLLVTATSLFLVPDRLTRGGSNPTTTTPLRRRLSWVLLLAAGVYGGYFGAGQGILLLAVLGMLGVSDLHERNGIKNVIAAGANGIAAVLFVSQGVVLWRDALVMGAGAVAGGYAGARLAQRLGRGFVRAAIIAIGLALTAWYLTHPVSH